MQNIVWGLYIFVDEVLQKIFPRHSNGGAEQPKMVALTLNTISGFLMKGAKAS